MAGIYIHIPFCKTRCSYCDFFTQTNKSQKEKYIGAIIEELFLRKNYLDKEIVETIYFGGGTPSQLSYSDLKIIFEQIQQHFNIGENPEITIEANPDDLNDEYVKLLKDLPFNRISIGIQSFDNTELKFIDRRHSAQEAKDAVLRCQQAGFNNISIDLMYGLPQQSIKTWESNLKQAVQLEVQHISSYHLIYEEGTKMHRLLKEGSIKNATEDLSIEMFSSMNTQLGEAEFIHYEISNYAKPGFISRHNSSYWTGQKYLGIGASAHSFNGRQRCWNISSLTKYIDGIEKSKPNIETEELDLRTQYNDYILTRMRTMWGIELREIERIFGKKYFDYCINNVLKYTKSKDVEIRKEHLVITEKGLFISDAIMSDLMYI